MALSPSSLTVLATMAIKTCDVPTILVERIETTHPAPALFSAVETQDWPEEVLPALLRQGVVAEADRAEAIMCPGCEWQCNKRVVVRKLGDTSRGFIMCDEEPQQGRVPVPMASLKRVKATLLTLGQIVAGELDIGPPKLLRSPGAYSLGTVNGRYGARSVVIAIESERAILCVGEQCESVGQVLKWGAAGLVLAAKLVRRLADRKELGSTAKRQHASGRSHQIARKAATRKRDLAIHREATKRHGQRRESFLSIAKSIAMTELARGLTPERVRRIITEQRGIERKNSRPKSKKRK